jgi:hypothetical protein
MKDGMKDFLFSKLFLFSFPFIFKFTFSQTRDFTLLFVCFFLLCQIFAFYELQASLRTSAHATTSLDRWCYVFCFKCDCSFGVKKCESTNMTQTSKNQKWRQLRIPFSQHTDVINRLATKPINIKLTKILHLFMNPGDMESKFYSVHKMVPSTLQTSRP